MVQVTLDDQQARIIAEANDVVEVLDHTGRVLGYVMHGFSADEISLARQRCAFRTTAPDDPGGIAPP